MVNLCWQRGANCWYTQEDTSYVHVWLGFEFNNVCACGVWICSRNRVEKTRHVQFESNYFLTTILELISYVNNINEFNLVFIFSRWSGEKRERESERGRDWCVMNLLMSLRYLKFDRVCNIRFECMMCSIAGIEMLPCTMDGKVVTQTDWFRFSYPQKPKFAETHHNKNNNNNNTRSSSKRNARDRGNHHSVNK